LEKIRKHEPSKPSKIPIICIGRRGCAKNKTPITSVKSGLSEFSIPDSELFSFVPARANKNAGMTNPVREDTNKYGKPSRGI
jgi:hypothetical protein